MSEVLTNPQMEAPTINRDDFFQIEVADGIATIWIDSKGEKMNVVSPKLIVFFDEIFDELNNNSEVKAAVFISRKKDFIAGADINSFKADKKGDFEPLVRRGHKMLNRIEKSKKPIVSAIHGTCYGLGVELSLACAGRVATKHSSTKLALPEVKLGLLPGQGGTQRLPRLIGVQKALDMMLTGKNIYARPALKMGLVDELVDPSKLHKAACTMAKKLAAGTFKRPEKKGGLLNKVLDTSLGQRIVLKKAREMAMQQSQGNYPAIPAIIDCVEYGLKNGMKKGLKFEAKKFEELILSDESKALISIFHNMTNKKKNPMPELVRPVKTIGMLGAGFMGAGITEVSVTKGYDVILKDIKDDYISKAKQQVWKALKKKLKRKSITQFEAQQTMNHINGQLDYDNFEHVDLIIEAVLEKMDLKKKIIKELEQHTNEDVIFASNTSSLSITEMAKASRKPENVIGMHYFSPVPKMPLLEIVKTDQTADWVIATCMEVGIKQGKTCIVVQDSPGFYVNRILAPYLNEVMLMIEEGVSITDMDRAMKKLGFPVGPAALMDEVGIDVGAHIMSGDLMTAVADREGITVSYALPKMFEAGLLGRKSGKGYYLYDPKTNKKKGENKDAYQYFGGKDRKKMDTTEIQNRGLMLMLNEAVMCLDEGIIANPTDGDVGAIFGIGFLPFTGGPFRYMDTRGISNIVKTMEALSAKFGPKFKPADMLYRMVANGETFHG